MKVLLFALLLTCGLSISAQKVRYATSLDGGVASGAAANVFSGSWVHGIRLSNWMLALGPGLDNYEKKTILATAMLRKSFTRQEARPFVYGSYSVAIPEDRNVVRNDFYLSRSTHYDNGSVAELGLGYTLPVFKKLGLNLSAGYSVKKIGYSYKWNYVVIDPFNQSKDENYTESTLRRTVFRVGLSF